LTYPHELNPLLSLALRAAGDYHSVTIQRLQRSIGDAEIKLTGDQIRMILDLALKTKLAENRRRRAYLKVVPPPSTGLVPAPAAILPKLSILRRKLLRVYAR